MKRVRARGNAFLGMNDSLKIVPKLQIFLGELAFINFKYAVGAEDMTWI